MAFKKRRLIQAISDRVPDDQDSLLEAVKKEVWPFLKQVRRLIFDATGGSPDPGGTQVVVNEGDTTVINTTINPSPFDDHLVKARTVDQTPVGGLIEKTKAGRKVQISLLNDNGVEKALFDVIEQTVDVTRRYLRLAGIVDPNLRAPVRGVAAAGSGGGMGSGSGGGLMVGLVFDSWNQIGGAAGTWTWRCGFNGTLQLYSQDQSVPCKKGDRILVTRELKLVLNIGYSYEAVDSAYPGIYEVLDPGSADTKAVIRRVQDANTSDEFHIGTVVQVAGEPKAAFYGKYFRFDAAGTISPDLTNVTCTEYAYVAPNQQQLLTDSEFALADLEPSPLYVEWEVPAGSTSWPQLNYFDTNAGIPGVSEVPAGTQKFYGPAFWVEGWNAQVNPGDVFVGYRIIKLPVAGDAVILLDAWDSAPVTNSTGQARNWQVDTTTIPLAPTDRIRLAPIARSTCAQPVTVHMLWNQPVDSPYWASTMQIPSAGDQYDHTKLLRRNDDGGDGRGQHDSHTVMVDDQTAFSGLLAGAQRLDEALAMLDRPTFRWRKDGWGAATINGTGVVTIPAPYVRGRLELSSSVTINGLDPDNWSDGQEATLLIQASVDDVATLTHFAADLPTNARLSLSRGDGAQFARYALLRLVLDTGSTHSWLSEAEPMVF